MNPILLAMAAFEIKHFVCDFALQNSWMIGKKGRYFHPGGLIHAGLHILGSLPALLLLTRAPKLIAMILAAEFIVHYHADFFKAKLDGHLQLRSDTNAYWIVFGLDQLIHQMTYITMIYAATTLAI